MYNLNGIIYKETEIRNYYVTSNGVVAKIIFSHNGDLSYYRRIKPKVGNNGYLRVEISGRHYLVHRLVYFTWSGDSKNKYKVIDHIDANILNNNISNLRQVTQKENIFNAICHGNFGHNHNTVIQVTNSESGEVREYDSIKSFMKAINAPHYMLKHGGISNLAKRKEYKKYIVKKIDEC